MKVAARETVNPPLVGICLGVLIDCFVTTKVIIPALMALIPTSANFWPRKPPRPAADTTSTMD